MPKTTFAPTARPVDCSRHSPCIDLSYIEAGTGEAVVLIHGLGGHAAGWEQQIRELSSSCRVIALDLRGHGNSGYRAEEAVTIRAFADDIAALLRGLEVGRAHVCGNSMGGLIALELWVRWPAWVNSLILASTTAFFPPPQILANFLGLFDQMSMEAWAGFMAPRLLRRGAPASLVEEVVQTMAATPRAIYRQGLIATFGADYRWVLPVVDIPALILVGEEDQATPVGYARFLDHWLQDSRFQIVPQAAHLPQQENPREFNRQLRAHLERLGDK